MIKVGVFGASGRVGKLVIENIKDDKEIEVSAVFARKNLDFAITSSI